MWAAESEGGGERGRGRGKRRRWYDVVAEPGEDVCSGR